MLGFRFTLKVEPEDLLVDWIGGGRTREKKREQDTCTQTGFGLSHWKDQFLLTEIGKTTGKLRQRGRQGVQIYAC